MNTLHRLVSLILALALCLSLAAPALAAQGQTNGNAAAVTVDAPESGTVTGFTQLENNEYTLNDKATLADVTARMPATLTVYLSGVEAPVELPVRWVCLDDYEGSNEYYYQFSPEWDTARYPLAEGLDLYQDAPYISVFLDEGLLRSVASNKNQIFEYLTKEMGLTPAAACGIMANIEAESGYKETVYAYDGSGSYGLCQWLGSRLTRLKSWTKNNGYDYKTVEGQMRYLDYELRTYYSSVYKYVCGVTNDAKGAYNAAYYWCVHFELPANKEKLGISRGNLAKNSYWPIYGAPLSSTPTLAGASKPAASIKEGTGVSVYGTIACADSITKVVAAVYDQSGKLATGTESVAPKAQFYSLNDLDDVILFSKLLPGSYTYVIKATAAKKNYTLLEHPFIVTDKKGNIVTAPAPAPVTAPTTETTETEEVALPAAVTGVKLQSAAETGMTLTWDSMEGVTKYYIYQSSEAKGTYTRIGTSTTNSFDVTGLTAETEYFFKLRAGNAAGAGPCSAVFSAATAAAPKVEEKPAKTETVNDTRTVPLAITTCALNIRKGPSTKDSVLKVAPKYTVFFVNGTVGDWYKVRYYLGSKAINGYVSRKYVTDATRAKTKKNIYLYKSTSTSSKKVKLVRGGKRVGVVGTKKVGGTQWLKVKFASGGKCYTGYCKSSVAEYY